MSRSKKYLAEGGITKGEEMESIIKKHVSDNFKRGYKANDINVLKERIKYYEGRTTGGTYGQRTYAREYIKVARSKLKEIQERGKREQDKRSKAKKITR